MQDGEIHSVATPHDRHRQTSARAQGWAETSCQRRALGSRASVTSCRLFPCMQARRRQQHRRSAAETPDYCAVRQASAGTAKLSGGMQEAPGMLR